ncbi:MAG TPA: PAS domain-containing protein [Dongiaceae bacterium]
MFLDLDANARHWIATNSDRRWALLLEYWNRLAQRAGRMPRRADIDPLALPVDLLPNVFLVDVVREADAAAPRFRFRLLGTAITSRETVRPGQFLDESLKNKTPPDDITPQYLACLERRVGIRGTNLAWDHPTKEFITYHVMLLPLSSDGTEVDTLLGLAIYEA